MIVLSCYVRSCSEMAQNMVNFHYFHIMIVLSCYVRSCSEMAQNMVNSHYFHIMRKSPSMLGKNLFEKKSTNQQILFLVVKRPRI